MSLHASWLALRSLAVPMGFPCLALQNFLDIRQLHIQLKLEGTLCGPEDPGLSDLLHSEGCHCLSSSNPASLTRQGHTALLGTLPALWSGGHSVLLICAPSLKFHGTAPEIHYLFIFFKKQGLTV
jgi:hypothetical protein